VRHFDEARSTSSGDRRSVGVMPPGTTASVSSLVSTSRHDGTRPKRRQPRGVKPNGRVYSAREHENEYGGGHRGAGGCHGFRSSAPIGGGYARYTESKLKADRSPNPDQRDTNAGALQFGGGIDLQGFGWLGFRAEARDIYTGARNFAVATPGPQVHNVVASAGLVVRFGRAAKSPPRRSVLADRK
jgi:hypothetical protein